LLVGVSSCRFTRNAVCDSSAKVTDRSTRTVLPRTGLERRQAGLPMRRGHPAPHVVQAGIFLGALGVRRFYLGYKLIGAIMLIITAASLGRLAPMTARWGAGRGDPYPDRQDGEGQARQGAEVTL
jgi:TM2 domain